MFATFSNLSLTPIAIEANCQKPIAFFAMWKYCGKLLYNIWKPSLIFAIP